MTEKRKAPCESNESHRKDGWRFGGYQILAVVALLTLFVVVSVLFFVYPTSQERTLVQYIAFFNKDLIFVLFAVICVFAWVFGKPRQ